MLSVEELHKRFSYHKPKTEQVASNHELVRNSLLHVTACLLQQIPESREASIFVTKMEEAMFWANAAIARNQ